MCIVQGELGYYVSGEFQIKPKRVCYALIEISTKAVVLIFHSID